jgi:RNA polymerase sigma-70 factor (ECF subfamily)
MSARGDEGQQAVEAVYRNDSRRVFATLVRILGDFDLAEEAMHDAFAAAVDQWPKEGVPANPRAWLVSAGRFKAIDTMRRRARFDASLSDLAERLDARSRASAETAGGVEDDRLRLSGSCGRRPRFATRASRMTCRPATNCPSGWKACSPLSISCSTRVTPRPGVNR